MTQEQAASPARVPRFAVLRNRPLLTLMLGHFAVDSYVGVIPVLYPLLVERFALNLRTVGLVSLAYSGAAALSQPIFGWLADRYGTRLIPLALVWTAAVFALIGLAPSFPALVALAAAAGLGSGAYHPFGALSAGRAIGAAQRNTAMAVYVTGGTLGVAAGPLLGVLAFGVLGLRGTALLCLPGLAAAVWMLRALHLAAGGLYHAAAPAAARPVPWGILARVVLVMMAVNGTLYSVEAFVPTWYARLGYPPAFYGALATTLLLAHAAGAVAAGALADRFGRRRVIVGSIALLLPSLLLFTAAAGPVAFVTAALLGLSIAPTGPLLLLTAQQLMARRAGVASGLILGLGFVTGAVGVPLTGALADAVGIPAALRGLAILVLAGLVLAWTLPDERVNAKE
ncbi:MAG TPA: MFS transporter [Roseiflexaceae bacterium]|nr:MFS transporter [Roseiflexaceae bacterium]